MNQLNPNIVNLPRARGDEGTPPSGNPFFANTLGDAFGTWYREQGLDHKDHAIPDAGPYRGSFALYRCDRRLYYAMAGTDESNAKTVADYWRFWLGQLVHDNLAPIVQRAFPGSLIEQVVDFRPQLPGSAHVDLGVVLDGVEGRLFVEIKTVNGFKFKLMTTKFNGPPEGPEFGALLQAGLAARSFGAERIVVLVLSLENLSPAMASFAANEYGRFMAEWHYTLDELAPFLDAETARIHQVLTDIDAGTPSPRQLHDPEYPVGAIIDRPLVKDAPWSVVDENDHLLASGTYWGCGYCPFLDVCKSDGASTRADDGTVET